MTEIEIKAHVVNPDETEKRILQIAQFKSETVKKDTYWKKESMTTSDDPVETKSVKVRLREENDEVFVTYKRKEVQGQIEVNDEQEFMISDRKAFEVLLGDIGFAPYITKNKKTKSFSSIATDGTEITIELSMLEGLGYFIEIEILADNPDAAETTRAQNMLFETLHTCGIDESAIESRYYTDLLMSSFECQGPKK